MNIAFCKWKVVFTNLGTGKQLESENVKHVSRFDCTTIFCTFLTPDFQNASWPSQKRKKRNVSQRIVGNFRICEQMNALSRFCSSFFWEIKHMMQSRHVLILLSCLQSTFCALYQIAGRFRRWNEINKCLTESLALHFIPLFTACALFSLGLLRTGCVGKIYAWNENGPSTKIVLDSQLSGISLKITSGFVVDFIRCENNFWTKEKMHLQKTTWLIIFFSESIKFERKWFFTKIFHGFQ